MPKLAAVQALRAFAAFAVAILHALHEGGIARNGSVPTWIDGLPWEAGVDVFFVISGFVMVFASRGLFGRPGARSRFAAHRLARVVPLYWLTTSLYLAVAIIRPDAVGVAAPLPGYVAASYLFWPTARPDGTVLPLFSLGWTLNYELFFYALFALALPLRSVWAVGVVTTALLLTVGLASAGAPLPFAFWGNSIVLEFAFGMGLGLLWLAGARLGTAMRLALAAAGLGLFATHAAGPDLPRAIGLGGPALLLVASAALAPLRIGSGIPRLVRPLILLGDASYALYLTHPFAIRGVGSIWMRHVVSDSPILFICTALVVAVLASVLVHLLIERPLVRWVRSWLEPRML